ncbi:glycoside hydrolase family 38 C-terminal domain-containing protein [Actinomyces sp. MRS3W]|uniref:glycoside hydrolase family 38 N-terminal domain-containing protein n=1 Tax=Actinomyces sp. MRS3W TaxID=2800796 RepID=UPI0028FD871B|nr:glycoside hydrolase family 38 C-terminal domain-containing protein [Actinomyces sp. MRS3W]MDU0349429.1 glycoside hydrolase family 38 C-terminal domain-containing protein [Actinomyces sp. MRS3W]
MTHADSHSGSAAATAMWIIPHTHWDREWYEPHDVFRARLVPVLDQLLDLLDHDGDYRFTLDGQTAIVTDYLAIRPENAERLRAAVARGQLAVGPFAILMDEFCCDGETLVRNLEQGIRTARGVGGEMRVGYIPDMFGHAAQMPQILNGFGLVDAALWRGAPALEADAFRWRAPDGSEVRVEYLWDGYGSALGLFAPPDQLDRLVAEYVRAHAARFNRHPPAGMYGTDHMSPRADLLELIRAHNARCPEMPLTVATLDQVIASRPHGVTDLAALPVVDGELRSHVRGNLLPGVLSVRTQLKAAMARAERALTTAERFDAAAGGPSRRALCERGWALAVESSAHDSVTGCGCDDTAEQTLTRLHVASHTACGTIDITREQLADRVPAGTSAVFNQSGWARTLQVETVLGLGADAVPPGAQLIEALPTSIGDELMTAADLPRILRRIHGRELFGHTICGYRFPAAGELVLDVSRHDTGTFELDAFTRDLRRHVAQADPTDRWHVVTRAAPSCRVLLAGRGEGLSTTVLEADRAVAQPVTAHGSVLSNGLVRADVDAAGRVRITDLPSGRTLERALALVDEGDRGDSYNYGPVSSGTVTEPADVHIEIEERGPLRGRIRIRRTYLLPVGLAADGNSRSARTREQVIDTRLEMREGEPFVRVRTTVVNAVANHRLRIHIPTCGRNVAESVAAGQYGVTRRGRTSDGGWGEYPLPTYPAARFVHAGGVAILTDRPMEYEIVTPTDSGPQHAASPDTIALTLLRAVGMMSINLHPLRDEPAGAELAVPGAQYLGTSLTTDFAIDLSCPDWDDSDLVRHADQFRFEPIPIRGVGESDTGQMPTPPLTTHGRVALESLRRLDDDVLEARFVNYHHHPEPLRVRGAGQWDRTDLTGTVKQEKISLWELSVPAATILTLRRRPASADQPHDPQPHTETEAES